MTAYRNLSREQLIAEIKRLKKGKKFGLLWEDKPEDVAELCKTKLPILVDVEDKTISEDSHGATNILIEGDNYHALSVLNYTHKGKIDVIYIDPPYNTGAQDWKYNNNYVDINDSYRHSKWLSMMSKRLQLAKNLLKNDGVLICTIDDNEFHHLGALLEEIFFGFEIHCVTIVHNPRGIQGSNFSYIHEYAYFVFRKGSNVIGARRIKPEDIDWRNLRDNGGESLRTDARNCFYPIIVENEKVVGFGDVLANDKHPSHQTIKKEGAFYVYPIDKQAIERKWRYARQSVESIQNLLRAKQTPKGYEIEIGKDFGTVRTVWQDSRYDANENGTKLVHALVPDATFDFPKSVFTTYDCIAPILYERKNALVLDYFGGSGTTGHAVLILNKEDKGQRSFILCTNNENKIAEDVCYPRIKKVIKGHKHYPDITDIPANLKYYRTDFVDADPTDKNKKNLTEKATELLCLKEGTFERVASKKTFKIYKNTNHYTGIIFDQIAIPDFKEAISKMKGKFSVYVFSLGDDSFEEEFDDIKQKVKLSPIPDVILRVYRRIFK